jgi:hypothetical protein
MEDQPSIDHTYLQKLLKRPSFIVFVAIKENEIIGGLAAYELPMYYGNIQKYLFMTSHKI